MSATPWVQEMGLRGADCKEHQPPVSTAVCLACLAKKRLAFDALLAFAKQVDPTIHDTDTSTDHCVACGHYEGMFDWVTMKRSPGHASDCALERLNRAHPGWREWPLDSTTA